MKRLIIGLAITVSMTSLAKTELKCTRGSHHFNEIQASASTDMINERIKELEGKGKDVEITSISVSRTATPETVNGKPTSTEVICAALKY